MSDALFEAAADAIISGNSATVERLLTENPELVRVRSSRDHHSTLLHYVSANGVEDFRQKTPKNIVEITKLLIHAGADVNAESNAYGGHSTALSLTATSCHPEAAGVQRQLLQLLIDHGATIESPDCRGIVNYCLRNGRGSAAEFLANHGAQLDFEGAAGIGRLDLVKTFFDETGRLRPTASENQLRDGFAWACEFGHAKVVDFLLTKGMRVDAKLRHHGQTGLHWAASGGHVQTVQLLLKRGASVDMKDETFGGTPLGWTLHSWRGLTDTRVRQKYCEVAALLVRTGATIEPQMFEHSDADMRAALRNG